MGQGTGGYRRKVGPDEGRAKGETPVDRGQPDPELVEATEDEQIIEQERPAKKEKASGAGSAKGKARAGSSRKAAPNNTRRLIIGAVIALVAVALVGVIIFLATRGGGPAPAPAGGAAPTEQAAAPTGASTGEAATAGPAVSANGATLAFDLAFGQVIELEVPGTGRFSLRGVDNTSLEIILGENPPTPVVADQPLIVNGVTVGRVIGGGSSSIRALVEVQPTQFFMPAGSGPYNIILAQNGNERAFSLSRGPDALILSWISKQGEHAGQMLSEGFQPGDAIDFTLNGVPVLNTSTTSDDKVVISLGS